MKQIMKKVKMCVGCTLTLDEVREKLINCEYSNEKGEQFYVDADDRMTVKVKGKKVNIEDVTISFEEDRG